MGDTQFEFRYWWHYTPYAVTVFSATLLLLRKRYRRSSVVFSAGLVWLWLLFPLVLYGYRGGVDSMLEVMNFETHEALFFLKTAATELIPRTQNHLYLTLFASCAGIIAAIAVYRRCRAFAVRMIESAALLGTATLMIVSVWQIGDFAVRNSKSFDSLAANFESGPRPRWSDASTRGDRPGTLRLVVYIGEATSTLHMSAYGYPRNTTPNLVALSAPNSANPRMLVWENVFSTHTHTVQSLLEALSIGFADEDPRPIWRQGRTSLPRTVSERGLHVELVSNQSLIGSWNRASLILFDGLPKHFSKNKFRGNEDLGRAPRERAYDDEFFTRWLDTALTAEMSNRSEVYFLHAYAGHGPYRRFIPERFQGDVDAFFRDRNPVSVLGHARTNIARVEAYDSAVRYVDHSINEVIRRVASDASPSVVVYLSDHGESAFSARGHDSSRFIHEMAQVPFMVFFNRAAADAFSERYRRMAELARKSAPATLAQLPATLMEILAIDTEYSERGIADPVPIGAPRRSRSMPIVIRHTVQGPSYVDPLNAAGSERNEHSHTWRDGHSIGSPTSVYAAAQRAAGTDSFVCYHRANTIATMLRGLMVTNCLELDVVVDSDERIEVVHPPKEPVGLELHEALNIAGKRARLLWIDAKNIDDPRHCRALLRELSNHSQAGPTILVEFSPKSHARLDELTTCALGLREQGFRVSWYVPTKRAIRCARDLSIDLPLGEACTRLRADLAQVSGSNAFSDLSFDYRALDAVQESEEAADLRLNVWGVAPHRVTEEWLRQFGAVIVDTHDPNHY